MSLPRVEGFVVVEKIGAGSYATVYKGYSKGSHRECVAIKCVERSSLKGSAVDNLITEISLLKSLNHPHIVTMKDFLWDEKNIYIIMEFCNYGDLSKYVKREKGIDERLCKKLLRQLAHALQLLREKGVVHMDLKPQNLLLHRTHTGNIVLKVGDFGFAQYMSDETKAKNMRGSPLYMAPEVFNAGIQRDKAKGYDASVDLWSVGVILFECLFGKAPYSSNTYKDLVEKILSHKPIEIPSHPKISADCKDILKRLLQHDPTQRISYEDFFAHPFLDMKHMPSPENYKTAVCLVQQAIEKDTSGDYEVAYHLYCDSLKYFVPIVIEDYYKDFDVSLRNKVNRYIKRAEELKMFTVGGHCDSLPSKDEGFHRNISKTSSFDDRSDSVPNSNSNIDNDVKIVNRNISVNEKAVMFRKTDNDDNCSDGANASNEVYTKEELPCINNAIYLKNKADFEKLYGLCSTTSQLQAGLDVGRSAEMYVRDGRLEEAFSLYQSAIATLLKGCQAEPQGVRKVMLRDKIEEWLKEAESIKSLLESREMQQQHIAEDVHKEQCCLQ